MTRQKIIQEIGTKKALKEVKRHFDIVAEGIDHKIALLAESVSGIQKQLVVLRDMVVKNTEDIEIIKTDIFTMKSDMEIMKSDIEIIKGGIKKKVDYEEFAALEKRIILLESKMRR